MKKTLFIAVLLALAATNLKAQDYEPIIQEGNEWHTLDVMVNPGFPPNHHYTLRASDTQKCWRPEMVKARRVWPPC